MTSRYLPLSWRRRDVLRRRFHVAILSALAIILQAGCATNLESKGTAGHSASALPAPYFSLHGRISVRVGEKIESGQIRWQKLPDEERLQVFTPFGSQVAELLKRVDGRVTMRRDGETIEAASIGDLTASLLGVPLDMDTIAIWIQGAGFKENESLEKRFDNGDPWTVTVEGFRVQGVYRHVSRLSAWRGETVVRLVIDEWKAE